jgi:hypothetical protein
MHPSMLSSLARWNKLGKKCQKNFNSFSTFRCTFLPAGRWILEKPEVNWLSECWNWLCKFKLKYSKSKFQWDNPIHGLSTQYLYRAVEAVEPVAKGDLHDHQTIHFKWADTTGNFFN